jgi:hypothetical protein
MTTRMIMFHLNDQLIMFHLNEEGGDQEARAVETVRAVDGDDLRGMLLNELLTLVDERLNLSI